VEVGFVRPGEESVRAETGRQIVWPTVTRGGLTDLCAPHKRMHEGYAAAENQIAAQTGLPQAEPESLSAHHGTCSECARNALPGPLNEKLKGELPTGYHRKLDQSDRRPRRPYEPGKTRTKPLEPLRQSENALGDATDWDAHYDELPDTVHRGYAMKISGNLYDLIHDHGADTGAVAKELITRTGKRATGPHWSVRPETAKGFALDSGRAGSSDLPIVLHAHKPSREDIETRPHMLKRMQVFDYGGGAHDEREVPLRKGRMVQVNGISWHPHEEHPAADEQGWIHHDFGEPMLHKAETERRVHVLYHGAAYEPKMNEEGYHVIPAGAHMHPDATHAWHHAIRQWNGDEESEFPRVYRTHMLDEERKQHQPAAGGGIRLKAPVNANETEHDEEKHPPIKLEDEHGPILYHGTTHYHDAEDEDLNEHEPPHEITASGGTATFGPGVHDPNYAYATKSLGSAWTYAEDRQRNLGGGTPHVYRVTPKRPADLEDDPTYQGEHLRGTKPGDMRAKSGFDVLDEVPPTRKQHAENVENHRDEHGMIDWDGEDEHNGEGEHWAVKLSKQAMAYDEYGDYYPADEDEDDEHGQERERHSKDWDDIHSGLTEMHRGISVHLRPEDHAVVHDASRPVHERAQHLLKALPHSELGRGQEGLGTHWTDNENVAESFGEMSQQANRHGWHPTSVVFHAHAPERHDIDEEPNQQAGEIYGFHEHGEHEIPVRPGGNVHLKGVSWKDMHEGGWNDDTDEYEDHEDREYNRHGFGPGGSHHHAAQDHATFYHVTDNPHFELSTTHRPHLNLEGGEVESRDPGIHMADHEGIQRWMGTGGYIRPYMVELHAPHELDDHPDIEHGYARERYVPAKHYDQLKVHRVIPLDAWDREQGGYGHMEQSLGSEYDTGKHIPGPLDREYRPKTPYAGPDVRSMTPEQHQQHADRYDQYMSDRLSRQAVKYPIKYTRMTQNGYEDAEDEIEGPLFHGSRSKRLKPGDMITPGRKTNPWGDQGNKSQTVHFTVHHQTAKDYADQAGGHIYEVEPTGVFKHDYSSGDFKSDHPLRVLRVANDWPTAKDIEAEGSRRTGALANPVESKHPHEWFHGSPHDFGEFYDTGSNGDDEDTRNHWNVMLGNHFTATHNVAHDFSLGLHHHVGDDNDDREEPLGHVIHARLNIKNPKVYGSEHEMDQEAYEHEHAAGNHIDKHLGDKPGDDSSDEEWDDWHDNAGPEKYYAGDSKEKYTADTPDPQVAYGFHPKATGWLNNHPDKEGIAARFKKRLMAAGHDGIVYGNEFERADAGGKETSAIAFHPHQIDITQHHYGKRSRCLTPEECERTGWSGQEMVPGTENLQRRADKSAGSRLTLPLPGDAWRRWLEDFFRRNRRSSPAESWQMGDDPAAPATPADGTGDSSGMSSTASWDDDDDDEPSYHCPACGEGHEDEETRDQHMGAWTDWDKQYPHLNDTIHRGMMAHLPEHVADVVHDESRPMHERAGALAEHVRREGDLGMHWTDQLQGTDKFSGGEASHSKFPVIVHAHKPERHHIEEDPDTLNDHDVINYHDHDEYEVPMRLGAPVKVKGISWRKPGGYNTEWQHHDFKEPMGMTAMRKQAHDSGDGQRIFHCPFCGAGQVIARSDGTVECEFCHTAFTVQVQPQFSSFPQTDPVTGQPIMIPGMPGQIDAPGTLPGAPGELPPGAEDDGSGNPFDDGSGGESGPPGAEESDDSGGDDNKPDFLKGSSFRTAAGDLLTEEAYTRHLALRFSANPEKMIATLRSSR
jgi:hypothetical protein